MSMGSGSGRTIPALTIRMARASNPRGTAAMWVRDRLDELFVDEDFADWYPADGRKGLSPARLAMVSVLQYAENLTDRQAAEAVRCRLDWKYCLGMDLDDSGFDYSVLSEFRDRMAEADRADRLLAVMVDHLVAAGLVKRRGAVRTDSTHVLAAVRTLNRTELVTETLRAALEQLALADEEWLAPLIEAGWADRYGRPAFYHRLPKGKAALAEHALQVGEDGMRLLTAAYRHDAPPRLRALRQVQVLRQVWVQQYWYDASDRLRWRDPKSTRDRLSRRTMPRRAALSPRADGRPDPATACVPWASLEIVSPYDPQARYSQKLTAAGQKSWIGYRDHQSETCGEAGPNVIVQVITQPAPEQDISVLDDIHRGLAGQGFTDLEHFVDAGYITPESIDQAARGHGFTLTGPVRPDPRARDHPGFTKAEFTPDWDARTLTCPRGMTSHPWKPTLGDGHERLSVMFPRPVCRACEDRLECTGNADGRGRHIILLPQHLQEIQTRVRREQDTPTWQEHYAIRAGCEATVSETVHAHGLRHCRYHGIAKTHVQHVLTAAGTNIIRLSGCLPPGTTPPRPIRPASQFRRLCRDLTT
ncbi:IS1182 family transposase [Streptomyces fuscichromogenes]|uniref:IS1182 family transposase n=1 Tax=Streptomyces fuscichromogenes TaxID=1324013 RepID=UPI0038018593